MWEVIIASIGLALTICVTPLAFYSFREMFFLAGFIGLVAFFINNTATTYEQDFIFQCGLLTIVATFCEGLVGHICNFDYHIWDYRPLSFSFWDAQCNLYFVFHITSRKIPSFLNR